MESPESEPDAVGEGTGGYGFYSRIKDSSEKSEMESISLDSVQRHQEADPVLREIEKIAGDKCGSRFLGGCGDF